MSLQQRMELDARVAKAIADMEAANGEPISPIEEDAIMLSVAQKIQAEMAAEEKARQQAQQAQQAQSAFFNANSDGILSALSGAGLTPEFVDSMGATHIATPEAIEDARAKHIKAMNGEDPNGDVEGRIEAAKPWVGEFDPTTAIGVTTAAPAQRLAPLIAGSATTSTKTTKTSQGKRSNTMKSLSGEGTQSKITTMQPTTTQPAEVDPALQIGSRGSYIPSTGFTTPNNAGGAQITISPVEFSGDNGGLQYGAMNALYADPKRAPSLGELLAFSSIMQGKKDLGGLDTVTATMQSADKMNAYAAQQNIAGRMQQLMQGGASADEARYQAISEEMLRNGQGRGAAAITIPEYTKAADAQAARNLDTALTAGGNYQANGAFGYTPLGIGSVTANSDGSYNMNVGGQNITGVAPEYTRMSVYGAIKGDGSGSKLANDYDLKYNDKLYSTTVDSMKTETEAAKILYDINKGVYGDPGRLSPEQKVQLAYEIERARALGREAGKAQTDTNTSGNKTGIDPKWFQENRMATLQQQQAFYRTHLPYAERAAQQLGTHPFNILGQMALESNWGQSIAGAHNYGNIMETRKGVQGVWANDNGNRRQFRNFANDQDYYNHFVGLMGRRYKGVQGAMSPQAYATALKAGGYAEDPNYVQSIGKMYNAVNKVAGTLGGQYTWNGQPTTAIPVTAGNGGGDNIRARPDAGPTAMNALQGAPQPQSNPFVGQLQPDAPQQYYANTMDSLGGYRIRRPDEWRNGGAQMIVPNGI